MLGAPDLVVAPRRRSEKETAGRTAGVIAKPPPGTITSGDFVPDIAIVSVFPQDLSQRGHPSARDGAYRQ